MKTIGLHILYFRQDQRSHGPRLMCSAQLGPVRALLEVDPQHDDRPTARLSEWQDRRGGVGAGWHTAIGATSKDYPWYTPKLRSAVGKLAQWFYATWGAHGTIGLLSARSRLARAERDRCDAFYRAALIAFDKSDDEGALFHVEREQEIARKRFDAASDAYHDAAYLCPTGFTYEMGRPEVDEAYELHVDDVHAARSCPSTGTK